MTQGIRLNEDYVPSGNEKGHPAWDIGQILTRHRSGAKGDGSTCARVHSLMNTRGFPALERLETALAVTCTCDAGDGDSERTTFIEGMPLQRVRSEAMSADRERESYVG